MTNGEHLDIDVNWSGLDPATRYIGAISHTTPSGVYTLTVVNIATP